MTEEIGQSSCVSYPLLHSPEGPQADLELKCVFPKAFLTPLFSPPLFLCSCEPVWLLGKQASSLRNQGGVFMKGWEVGFEEGGDAQQL